MTTWLLFGAFFPRRAAWFLLLWVPVQGWAQLNLFDDSNATVLIYEFMILGLYLVFSIKALKFPRTYRPPAVLLFAVPFAIWTIVLIPQSIADGGFTLTAIGLRTYLLPLPLVWLGYQAVQTRTELEQLGTIVFAEMAVIGAITALQFANVVSPLGEVIEVPTGFNFAGALRPPGTFSTPGHLGMYVLAMVPLGIGFLGLRTTWPRRIFYSIGLAGAFLALVVNSQRAAVVLLCASIPMLVLLTRRANALKVFALSLGLALTGAVLGLSIVGDAFVGRVRSISDDANYALMVAPVERMTDALRTPLAGGGLGTASPGTGRLDLDLDLEMTNSAESFMAALVYEFGVPGLIFFYAYLAALTISGFHAFQQCRRQDVGLLAAAILVYEILVYLQSWTYDPLHYPPSRVIFWFWAGVLLSLPRIAQAHPQVVRPPFIRPAGFRSARLAGSADRPRVATF